MKWLLKSLFLGLSCRHLRLWENMSPALYPIPWHGPFKFIPDALFGDTKDLDWAVGPLSGPIQGSECFGALGVDSLWGILGFALVQVQSFLSKLLETALWIVALHPFHRVTPKTTGLCYLLKLECSGWVAVSGRVYGYSSPSLLFVKWLSFISHVLGSDMKGLVMLFWPLQRGFRKMARMGRKKPPEITCFGKKRRTKCIHPCLILLYYYKKKKTVWLWKFWVWKSLIFTNSSSGGFFGNCVF